ncbi:PPC domain-containing protein [Nocardia noduli]|uniref:PPC domain-containing protein n=1 Tax=Nocardia noduli TaxID=2815722 RepID=UPI001C213423|nr:PPC domain-containing protein [Nocardia noduli]
MASNIRTVRAASAIALATVATTVAVAFAGTAHAGVYTEVEFAPGTSAAVVDGAVVRGDADSYFFEARRGQVLDSTLTSVEGNANLSISGPDGPVIVVSDAWTRIVLPSDGFYRVTVAPTRGNATYTLYVEIV